MYYHHQQHLIQHIRQIHQMHILLKLILNYQLIIYSVMMKVNKEKQEKIQKINHQM